MTLSVTSNLYNCAVSFVSLAQLVFHLPSPFCVFCQFVGLLVGERDIAHFTSKQVDLELNVEKAKYVLVSCEQMQVKIGT